MYRLSGLRWVMVRTTFWNSPHGHLSSRVNRRFFRPTRSRFTHWLPRLSARARSWCPQWRRALRPMGTISMQCFKRSRPIPALCLSPIRTIRLARFYPRPRSSVFSNRCQLASWLFMTRPTPSTCVQKNGRTPLHGSAAFRICWSPALFPRPMAWLGCEWATGSRSPW